MADQINLNPCLSTMSEEFKLMGLKGTAVCKASSVQNLPIYLNFTESFIT